VKMMTIWPVSSFVLYLTLGTTSPTRAFTPVPCLTTTSSGRNTARRHMAMPELPSDVIQYSTVPTLDEYFTATSIPRGLLKDHSTRSGTWGIIRVSQGLLQYSIQDEEEVFQLSADMPGVIEPERKHSVKALSHDVQFVVEFYRLPVT